MHINATYTGLSTATLQQNLYSNYSSDYSSEGSMSNFASVFGVLFSGVTGIMAGANMSGNIIFTLFLNRCFSFYK